MKTFLAKAGALLKKFVSRKLLVTIVAPLVLHKWPELLPLVKLLAPSYVLGQAGVDIATAINAWKGVPSA